MKSLSIFFIGLSFFLQSCSPLSKIISEYDLVWQEDFEQGTQPDSTRWAYESGYIRNNELQRYTSDKENVRIENGLLILEAHKEEKEVRKGRKNKVKKEIDYTSASLHTAEKAAWQYGYFEMRARLPEGRGIWPAFWLLAEHYNALPDDDKGEVDIMEYVGYEKNKIIHALHAGASGSKNYAFASTYKKVRRLQDEFHTFGLLWTPKKLSYYIDGRKTFEVTKRNFLGKNWVFDQKFHLKINLAVGGMLGGKKGINDKIFPQKMYIDYIKVFQQKPN